MENEDITSRSRKLGQLFFRSSLIPDIGLFIKLRWIAAAGVIAFAVFLRETAGMTHFFLPCLVISGIILLFNTGYLLEYRYLVAKGSESAFSDQAFAGVQILVDWFILTFLAYYTGGIISPFVFFYVFHIIIAAILLPRIESYISTAFACLLVGVFVMLQLSRIVSYHPLTSESDSAIIDDPLKVILLYLFFAAMMIISSFFATTLVGRIRRRNEQLNILRRDLETALAKLKGQDQALMDLTHKTAHELRSPLTAIQSILNVILQGYSGKMPQKMGELLQRAETRSQSLIKMTSELLDLARKREIKEKEARDIVLNDVLENVFNFLASRAESKELKYNLELPEEKLFVFSRQEDVQLLFSNLIENAIKYTPKGKSVSVQLSKKNGSAKLIVADEGIGIPEESQLNIFDRFYRAPNARSVEALGTGLGLSLVKRIVDSYHATIMFSSKQYVGTTFTIILPLNRSEVPEQESTAANK